MEKIKEVGVKTLQIGIVAALITVPFMFTSSEGTSYVDNPTTTRSYETTGDMDCSDFSSQSEAQDFFENEGGPDTDYHNLDRNRDGVACESLN